MKKQPQRDVKTRQPRTHEAPRPLENAELGQTHGGTTKPPDGDMQHNETFVRRKLR